MFPSAINDSDQMVGTTQMGFGFVRQANGSVQPLSFVPGGINNSGIIIGANDILIGNTDYTPIVPGFTTFSLFRINNSNEIVGLGMDANRGNVCL